MFYEYLAILIAIIFAISVASTFWSLSHFFGPRNRTPEKMIPYECGSDTMGTRDIRFSIKFYPVLVLFLLFDVAVIFFYLFAVSLKTGGWHVFAAILPLFIFMIVILFYAIRKAVFLWRT